MNCDWESFDGELEEYVSSLHIPINAEAKKAYDKWCEDDCNDRWWDKKEIETIETPTQNNPCYSDMLKDILALKDDELLEDFYKQDYESMSRRLKIEKESKNG